MQARPINGCIHYQRSLYRLTCIILLRFTIAFTTVTRFSVAALALAPFAINTIRKSGIDVETVKGAISCGGWVAFGTSRSRRSLGGRFDSRQIDSWLTTFLFYNIAQGT